MKAIIATITLLASISAIATPPVYNPKTATCDEIQTGLENYGTVLIQRRYLLGQIYFIEASSTKQKCPRYHNRFKLKLRTADGIKCNLGYYCKEWDIND